MTKAAKKATTPPAPTKEAEIIDLAAARERNEQGKDKARPHLTPEEAAEFERVEALPPEERAIMYELQVEEALKAPPGVMPDMPLFLRGPTQAERNAQWEAHVKEKGYTSARSFFVGKEVRSVDPSTVAFLQEMAMLEEARRSRASVTPDDPASPKPKRAQRAEASERKAKRHAAGMITVQAMAEELSMLPRDARAALRAAKIPKPDIGWAGDEAWAATIRPILEAASKGDKPKRAKGEAKVPRGKRKAKEKELVIPKGTKIIGSSKAKTTRPTQPTPPKYTNPIERHHGEQLTTNKVFITETKKTDAQIKSAKARAAKKAKVPVHKVKITDVLKAQGKRGAKTLKALKAAKKAKRK